MKRSRNNQTFNHKLSWILSKSCSICLGMSALFILSVSDLSAQQNESRGNKLTAPGAETNLFSSFKELRERASERYSQMMNMQAPNGAKRQNPMLRFRLREDETADQTSGARQVSRSQTAQQKQRLSAVPFLQGEQPNLQQQMQVRQQQIRQMQQMQARQQQMQARPSAPQSPQQYQQQMVQSRESAAAPSTDQLAKASMSPESAAEVIAQIPWKSLSASNQQVARSLVTNYTFYRRLPMTGGYCNPEVYDYILCHPEVIVAIWEAGGFKQISLSNSGNGHLTMRDSSGTHANVDVIYHDNEKMIFHAVGSYEGQLSARPIQGDLLCVVQYRFTEDTANENKPIVVTRFDAFVRMSSASTDLVGRAFAPMIGKVADSNFVNMAGSLNQVSDLMETNPQELAEVIQASSSISAATKEEFLGYIERVTGHASMRSQGVPVDYYLAPKMNVAKSEPAKLLSRKNENNGAGMVTVMNEDGTAEQIPAPLSPAPAEIKPSYAKNAVLPLPGSSLNSSSASVSASAKPHLEEKSVLSDDTPIEDFSLNNDLASNTESEELVFTDDDASSDSEIQTASSENTLNFDIENQEEKKEKPSLQNISVSKPVSEKAETKKEAEPVVKADEPMSSMEIESSNTADDEGWNAVSPSVADTAAEQPKPFVLNERKTAVSSGQKCSWKKPEIR